MIMQIRYTLGTNKDIRLWQCEFFVNRFTLKKENDSMLGKYTLEDF